MRSKLSIWIVQEGVWESPLESLPLAAGYLKACLDQAPATRERVTTAIRNFKGGEKVTEMAQALFAPGPAVLSGR